MKKIICVFVVSISIFLIYFFNRDTLIYYVALGDKNHFYYKDVEQKLSNQDILEKSNFNYLKDNNKLKNIYKAINNNVEYENQTIKNALIKADLVTVYLDNNHLIDSDFSTVDEEIKELTKLLKLIKSYCKEKIILIGPDDNNSGSLKYYNKLARNSAYEYDVEYIKNSKSNDLIYDIISKIK